MWSDLRSNVRGLYIICLVPRLLPSLSHMKKLWRCLAIETRLDLCIYVESKLAQTSSNWLVCLYFVGRCVGEGANEGAPDSWLFTCLLVFKTRLLGRIFCTKEQSALGSIWMGDNLHYYTGFQQEKNWVRVLQFTNIWPKSSLVLLGAVVNNSYTSRY